MARLAEAPQQFTGVARYGGATRPATPGPSRAAPTSPQVPGGTQQQQGLGLGAKGLGKWKGIGLKRHKKVLRDTIHSVTKGDIRRLARRGGVKRISNMVYDDVRQALKQRLEIIMKDIVAVVEYGGRRTVTVRDVIFTLNRLGKPIYGFDPSFIRER
ncbi:histone-fold-containing protein [Lojkania enalia]|uniref:Histone H4 n=1 Tax=Lojkania enalia TaxID=147567 RepID=A0A9P4KBX5_9PLEO|nr:histone-fold-containing protein [Didymosphaeria enalia]